MLNLIYLANIANIFRIKKLQYIYFLIDNVDLYQFHSNDYEGVTQAVLEQIQFFSNWKWTLIPEQTISDWINNPYEENAYVNFTNEGFLKA